MRTGEEKKKESHIRLLTETVEEATDKEEEEWRRTINKRNF